MNFTILQSYDESFRPLAELSLPNVAAYAAKHGYNHRVNTKRLVEGRHPSWDKVQLGLDWLENSRVGEWALILDVDAVVLSMDRSLESLIPPDRDFSVVVCADGPEAKEPWQFNAGVMLVQSTGVASDLFQEVRCSKTHPNAPNWEQEAFQEISRVEYYADHIHVYPNHLEFNHRGPFIHHFCGCGSVEERVKLMREELHGAFGETPVCQGFSQAGNH